MSVYKMDFIRCSYDQALYILNQFEKNEQLQRFKNEMLVVQYEDGSVTMDLETWHGSPFDDDSIDFGDFDTPLMWVECDNDGNWYIDQSLGDIEKWLDDYYMRGDDQKQIPLKEYVETEQNGSVNIYLNENINYKYLKFSDIFPEPKFYVAEDMEYQTGKCYKGLNVVEAVEKYNSLKNPKGIKGIGVTFNNNECDLVYGTELDLDYFMKYAPAEMKNNLKVNESIGYIYDKVPNLRLNGNYALATIIMPTISKSLEDKVQELQEKIEGNKQDQKLPKIKDAKNFEK